jgi:hypothetical protein
MSSILCLRKKSINYLKVNYWALYSQKAAQSYWVSIYMPEKGVQICELQDASYVSIQSRKHESMHHQIINHHQII